MVIPYKFPTINIPKNENGIPKATHNESLKLKNNPNAIKTSNNPIPPLSGLPQHSRASLQAFSG